MRYARGASNALARRDFDSEEVGLVLDRLERAVPHLNFDSWSVGDRASTPPRDTPQATSWSEVVWKDNRRERIEVAIETSGDTRISSICYRVSGAVSQEDYDFLLNLAEEAAGIIAASVNGDVSLFEFGNRAVAAEIQSRARVDYDPTPILRFVRSLAQETYENQRLAYGLILTRREGGILPFAQAFDNPRIKRLTDGFSTAIILDRHGNVFGYTSFQAPTNEGTRTARRPWWVAGLAEESYRLGGVGIALNRTGDILVLHNNRLQLSLRAGKWRIWNHAEILARLLGAWSRKGDRRNVDTVLRFLYHVAIDLSYRRSGGLLVVVGSDKRLSNLLMSRGDRVGALKRDAVEFSLDLVLESALVHAIDRRLISDFASLDGALVVNRVGKVVAYGAMTKSARNQRPGARTRAAIAASREGIAIKVSSDGQISFYANGDCFMEI